MYFPNISLFFGCCCFYWIKPLNTQPKSKDLFSYRQKTVTKAKETFEENNSQTI